MTTPNSDLERIYKLETDIKLLSKDSDIQTKTLEKMESVIDRSETHIEALNRSMLLYEERLKTQEKINMVVESSLKELNQKLDNLVVEIEAKIDDSDERRLKYLELLKKDLVLEIKEVIPKDVVEPDDDGKFKVFKFLVDNWKYIAFAVAILGGLMFHKWGLLTAILGMTAGS